MQKIKTKRNSGAEINNEIKIYQKIQEQILSDRRKNQ